MNPSSNKSSQSAQYRFLNPNKEPLTAEKLLTFSGCEHYSPEQAAWVVENINRLACLLIEYHKNNSICIDNQLIVNLNSEPETLKVIPLNPNSKAA